MGASGFHGDTFSQGFGDFSTMKKRRLGMGASGFHGDTFSQGFGDFSTMKKRTGMESIESDGGAVIGDLADFNTIKKNDSEENSQTPEDNEMEMTMRRKREVDVNKDMGMNKRRPNKDSDTFDDGFSDSDTIRNNPEMKQQLPEGEEEELRMKRNLEESELLQVESKPPIESDIEGRRRRSVHQEDDLEDDNQRPLFKRSLSDDTEGLGDFHTVRKRR